MGESVRLELGHEQEEMPILAKGEQRPELSDSPHPVDEQPPQEKPAMSMSENDGAHLDDSSMLSAPLLGFPGKAHDAEVPQNQAKKAMSHIAHLNGLRALAFLGVVLFHFKHGCEGGFLGVDVFFVLSGYLMTRSIRSQIEKGTFSYRSFIVRRFWRLYPALLCTILGTLLLSYLFFADELVAQVAKSSEASIFAISNVLFKSEDGYFGTMSTLKPLLHTWSLSVEWQFYLFWPFLMLGIHYCDVLSVWPYAILSVISFGYGVFSASNDPEGAFFLLPGRVFEFGLGAIVLTSVPAVTSEILANLMSISGTALIVASFQFLDSSMAAPAVIALPALFGSLLVIASPSEAKANRLFTFPIMDYIGKISYSAYLVHWPVYVFFNNIYEYSSPPLAVELIVVTLMMSVSAAMYHHVEDKMRTGRDKKQKIIGFCMVAATLLLSHHALKTGGWKGRYTTARAGMTPAYPSTYYAKELKDLYNPTLRVIPGSSSKLTYGIVSKNASMSVARGDAFDAILVGDSFAAPFTGALNSIAEKTNKSFVVSSHFSCSPFFDKDSMDPTIKDYPLNSKRGKECKDNIRHRVLDLIKGTKTDTVILAGNWLATSQMWKVVHNKEKKTSSPDPYISSLEQTVSLLRDLGKKVVVIGMVPGAHYNPRACLASSGLLAFLKNCPTTTRYAEPILGPEDVKVKIRNRNTIRQTFNDLATESVLFRKGISEHWLTLVDPYESLCDSATGECSTIHDGELVYYDDHHLNSFGAALLTDAIYTAWNDVNPKRKKKLKTTVKSNTVGVRDLMRSVLHEISALGTDYEQAPM